MANGLRFVSGGTGRHGDGDQQHHHRQHRRRHLPSEWRNGDGGEQHPQQQPRRPLPSSGGTATVANSTISGTSSGGVLFLGSGTATVTNSTFAGNFRSFYFSGGGAATLTNTLLAKGAGGNCDGSRHAPASPTAATTWPTTLPASPAAPAASSPPRSSALTQRVSRTTAGRRRPSPCCPAARPSTPGTPVPARTPLSDGAVWRGPARSRPPAGGRVRHRGKRADGLALRRHQPGRRRGGDAAPLPGGPRGQRRSPSRLG